MGHLESALLHSLWQQVDSHSQQAVALLPGITALPTPQGLRLTCPRDVKVAALAALAPLGTRLADVQIHEPSLEDVYFGLREL